MPRIQLSAMTAGEYRAALDGLGMTQGQAAEFLDVSIRSSNGYANGSPIPKIVGRLLRVMVALKLKPEDVP